MPHANLDMDWVRTQYPTTEALLEAARSILTTVNHPDTGMYGTIAALVATVENLSGHVCEFTVPVYKLGHFGGQRPLCMRCRICGEWNIDTNTDNEVE